jgi:peptidylprolyl isomerase
LFFTGLALVLRYLFYNNIQLPEGYPIMRKLITPVLFLLCLLSLSFHSMADSVLKLEIVTKTGEGTVLIKLLPDVAPKHVERIKLLANEGAYNNVVFHRVIPNFMAQTGDVKYGNRDHLDDRLVGTGESSYADLYAELSEIPFTVGVVGMARSRYINSANSQFFIMTSPTSSLNGKYTVVGTVTEGLNVIKGLSTGSGDSGKVASPDFIRKASILSSTGSSTGSSTSPSSTK